MTHLLIIGYVWPEPESSAAGSRMMQLIELFLQQGWQITFASPASPSEHASNLEALGIQNMSIEVNNSSFDVFLQASQPDIVIFDRFMMEEQFSWRVDKVCPHALKILETSDLHSLRYARQQAHKEKREVCQQDYHSDIAKREIASILRTDITLVISSWEMQHLEATYKIDCSLLHYIPFIIDTTDDKACDMTTFEQRRDFIFIGNFFHEPNWDAVLYLKQTIWPQLCKKTPTAKLNIYGAYTPEKALQLNNPAQGFYVRGRAESVEHVMSSSRVCLAPLRFGAGIKGKLVDAMRYGTPSVTSRIGAEGMHGSLNWNGFIEDDADRFVDAAYSLYEQKELWVNCQQNGFDIIGRLFNKTEFASCLFEKIELVRANMKQHRLNNFTGSMLMHHHMRSTEYLSRWIEAKNK